MTSTFRWTALLALLAAGSAAAFACGDDSASSGPVLREGTPADASTSGPGFGEGGLEQEGGSVTCVAPDMLIALDRTQTMHRTANGDTPPDTAAGHATSKWWMAIEGIEQLTAPPFDQGVRFGLELWPKLAPGCVTLQTRIQGDSGTNASCLEGEVVVDTALGTGGKIAQLLDPETTPICFSTPTGSALAVAKTYLEARKEVGKKQFVVLVTDGADWDVSCPTPNPLDIVDQLATAGISTVIVGFSAEASLTNGVGAAFLNDMACAGGTAKGFPAGCTKNAKGAWRATDPDAGPSGRLFQAATNTTELSTSLRDLAKTVCCDCVK